MSKGEGADAGGAGRERRERRVAVLTEDNRMVSGAVETSLGTDTAVINRRTRKHDSDRRIRHARRERIDIRNSGTVVRPWGNDDVLFRVAIERKGRGDKGRGNRYSSRPGSYR